MKKFILFILLAPIISVAQQTLNKSITHDGLTRDYIIHVPNSYDGNSNVPLLFCFHGYTSSANTIMNYSGFNAKSDQNNFIVVYPQGTLLDGSTHWNVGGWTLNSTVDDVDFTDKLLDTIINDYKIDEEKVYSTGMSNGGYMSFILACQLSNRFAAIASVTGSMTPQTYDACNPSHPTPVLQIHGTSDGTVPYNGSSTWTKSINDVLEYWTKNNNCNVSPTTIDIEDINTSDNSTVEFIKYNGCDDCSNLEHYKITGGDHDWPDVWGNKDIDATDLVWEFLSKYDINGRIDCGTINIEENESPNSLKLINTNTELKITGLSKSKNLISIYSINGELVLTNVSNNTSSTINISDLQSGLYLIQVNNQTLRFVKE